APSAPLGSRCCPDSGRNDVWPGALPCPATEQLGGLQSRRPRITVRGVEPEVLDLQARPLCPVVVERPPHGRADEAIRAVIEVWCDRLVRVGKDTPLFHLLGDVVGPAPEFE